MRSSELGNRFNKIEKWVKKALLKYPKSVNRSLFRFTKNKNGSAQQWLHAMPVKTFERKMEVEKPAQAAKARLRQFGLLLPALAFVKWNENGKFRVRHGT
ncbi:MAG: hypothetical protein MRY83_10385 [Flavobacteriales bacterium]|nr:hypothetical protein [Flavobacteriales bacterium]